MTWFPVRRCAGQSLLQGRRYFEPAISVGACQSVSGKFRLDPPNDHVALMHQIPVTGAVLCAAGLGDRPPKAWRVYMEPILYLAWQSARIQTHGKFKSIASTEG